MGENTVLALIAAGVVLIVFFTMIVVFRNRIEKIEAGPTKISISLSARQEAISLLEKAEKARDQQQESNVWQLADTVTAIRQVETVVPKTVLWVDDVPENNNFIAETLRRLGITVVQVTDNSKAFAFIGQNKPDIVITDIGRNNQDSDGYDLVGTLTQLFPKLPTIMYTSQRYIEGKRDEAKRRGVWNITSSPAEIVRLTLGYLGIVADDTQTSRDSNASRAFSEMPSRNPNG